MTRRHSLREVARQPYGPALLAFIFSLVVGMVGVLVATFFGFLPYGRPFALRDPCDALAGMKTITDGRPLLGRDGRAKASCRTTYTSSATGHTDLEIDVAKKPGKVARAEHDRSCAALAGMGVVEKPVGLGDAACAVIVDGRLRSAVVLVRRGNIAVTLAYSTETRKADEVRRVAFQAAQAVASSA
ncbi:hypothetical protein [Actinomadura rudentiformis]|uniref:DUF3558 domain-containing protein n=1 Tax=Actinomadura rudentiformis TaxID=359158 RepID=A0A6H9YMH2_9ACTN|nr:hypothetical protein [Actinomadura rudentiformis]KAB2344489.1 hypothetical protein F8566_31690 [Actinomadura rudentiformis]